MCVQHIPSPADNAQTKVENIYTGPTDTNLAQDMLNCDPEVSFYFVLSVTFRAPRPPNF